MWIMTAEVVHEQGNGFLRNLGKDRTGWQTTHVWRRVPGDSIMLA